MDPEQLSGVCAYTSRLGDDLTSSRQFLLMDASLYDP